MTATKADLLRFYSAAMDNKKKEIKQSSRVDILKKLTAEGLEYKETAKRTCKKSAVVVEEELEEIPAPVVTQRARKPKK
jgi:hypothetical protein